MKNILPPQVYAIKLFLLRYLFIFKLQIKWKVDQVQQNSSILQFSIKKDVQILDFYKKVMKQWVNITDINFDKNR